MNTNWSSPSFVIRGDFKIFNGYQKPQQVKVRNGGHKTQKLIWELTTVRANVCCYDVIPATANCAPRCIEHNEGFPGENGQA